MWKYVVGTGLLIGIFAYARWENAETVEPEQQTPVWSIEDQPTKKPVNRTERKPIVPTSISVSESNETAIQKHHPLLGPFVEHRSLPTDPFERNELVYKERHVFLQNADNPDLQKSPLYDFKDVESYLGHTYQGALEFFEVELPSIAIELTIIVTEREIMRSASSRHHHQVFTDIAIYDRDNLSWRRAIQRDPTETSPGRVQIGGIYYPDDVPPNLSFAISKKIFPELHTRYFETIVSKISPSEHLPRIAVLRELKASFDLDDIRSASVLSGNLLLGLGYSSDGKLHKLWMSTKTVGSIKLKLVK